MPTGYATPSILGIYKTVKANGFPEVINAGSYGPKPGYHNCRAQLPGSDYSVQRQLDQSGDPWAGAAIDLTLYNPADMKRATSRLIHATQQKDRRLRGLREFFGTVGSGVTGMDVADVRWVTSDPSHLWHVHLSLYRHFTNDQAACQDIAAVFCGLTGGAGLDAPKEDDDMKFKASTCTKPQPIPSDPSKPKTIWVDDEGHLSIAGNSEFQTQVQLAVTGLPVGKSLMAAFYTVDVKKDGSSKRSSEYGWQEMAGTSGSTFASFVQLGNLGKHDGFTRMLRVEVASDSSGVVVKRATVRSFIQPSG